MDNHTKLAMLVAKKKDIENKLNDPKLCEGTASVYARITGYYRSVANWNKGKSEEYKERKEYTL
jgi:anaerobic ribonucleoside-triphosphate reductase